MRPQGPFASSYQPATAQKAAWSPIVDLPGQIKLYRVQGQVHSSLMDFRAAVESYDNALRRCFTIYTNMVGKPTTHVFPPQPQDARFVFVNRTYVSLYDTERLQEFGRSEEARLRVLRGLAREKLGPEDVTLALEDYEKAIELYRKGDNLLQVASTCKIRGILLLWIATDRARAPPVPKEALPAPSIIVSAAAAPMSAPSTSLRVGDSTAAVTEGASTGSASTPSLAAQGESSTAVSVTAVPTAPSPDAAPLYWLNRARADLATALQLYRSLLFVPVQDIKAFSPPMSSPGDLILSSSPMLGLSRSVSQSGTATGAAGAAAAAALATVVGSAMNAIAERGPSSTSSGPDSAPLTWTPADQSTLSAPGSGSAMIFTSSHSASASAVSSSGHLLPRPLVQALTGGLVHSTSNGTLHSLPLSSAGPSSVVTPVFTAAPSSHGGAGAQQQHAQHTQQVQSFQRMEADRHAASRDRQCRIGEASALKYLAQTEFKAGEIARALHYIRAAVTAYKKVRHFALGLRFRGGRGQPAFIGLA